MPQPRAPNPLSRRPNAERSEGAVPWRIGLVNANERHACGFEAVGLQCQVQLVARRKDHDERPGLVRPEEAVADGMADLGLPEAVWEVSSHDHVVADGALLGLDVYRPLDRAPRGRDVTCATA